MDNEAVAAPALAARLSRRRLFGGAAGVAAAAVLAGCTTVSPAPQPERGGTAAVPFYGAHQAGIATAAQDRLAFAAFDLTTSSCTDLQDLLRVWTQAAAAMTAGLQVPGGAASPLAPPSDTGEALGLSPARLTVSLGLGPSLFDGRFDLAARRPAALADLPPLPGDALDPARSGGDLGIQACANDPQVAFHVVRNLARLGRGVVVMRWSQLGFGRTSSTSAGQSTPRNLMGFKDGTRNVHGEESAAMATHVWVGDESDQPWLRGGSYLVARRIRMLIESWDRDALGDQENVFGRTKASGAPLTGNHEFDTPDFSAARADGSMIIPAKAHIRLASAENNDGLRLLRRGYSYTDGIDPVTGELDAGLFFIAFQQDPRRQFVALQRKLGVQDALNEYIKHTGSALFACPAGVSSPAGFWADTLFA
jgi:deferrochelatase/peroxidase EfeB